MFCGGGLLFTTVFLLSYGREVTQVRYILHASLTDVNAFADLKETEATSKRIAPDDEAVGTPTTRREKKAKRTTADEEAETVAAPMDPPMDPGAYREQVMALCK